MDQMDDVREVTVMDLDLNQEPLDSSTGSGSGSRSRLGSILNELEIAHGQIEERIRQLEAVTERARDRQRWRQARNPPETADVMVETTSHNNALIETPIQIVEARDENNDRHKNWLKDSGTDLVAKALKMDTNLPNAGSDGGGFFDCNICLEMAREPILTCCGHLFCWACFYQLPCDAYSTTKECPVCKGEVADASITPIYGNGNVNHVQELESGLKVPPRPRARRVESVRQQRVNRRMSHVPVAEALRRIRMGIGITWERPHRHHTEVGSSASSGQNNVEASPLGVLPNPTEVGGRQGFRSRQFSSVLSESADSLLSISSALNNAERLVDDLESYIHNRVGGNNHEQVVSFGNMSDDPLISTTDVAIPSQEHQTGDSSSVGVNSSLPVASSSSRGRLSMLHLEHQSRDPSAGEMNVADNRPSSSSSRRRLRLSRVSDADQPFSRESQRRRLG